MTNQQVDFPKWFFQEHSPGVKAVENTNGEHFGKLNSEGKSAAFIRESFQNSIDGAVSDELPVSIRIYLSGDSQALQPSVWRKYFGSLLDHVEASIDGLPMSNNELADLRVGTCKFVVIEDFGTSGLTGAADAWNFASGATEENHFFHFYRTVGRTGKVAGRLGSWGVGKFVFLMASQLRAMLGYTVPASGPTAGQQLLMGQSTLRYHVLNGTTLVNDGWFGDIRDADSLSLPLRDPGLIEEFRRDWAVKRDGEPGFSVVVPFADELDSHGIIKTVIHEYGGKILEGKLHVHIDDGDVESERILSRETLLDHVAQYRSDPEWSEIIRKLDALSWYISLGDKPDLRIDSKGLAFKKGEWDLTSVQDSVKESARQILQEQGRLCVRVPVMIHPHKDAKDKPAYFDVVIGRLQGSKRQIAPEFFRKWLRISGQQTARLNGIETYVMVSDGALNDLLRDAEGPAHTSWSANAEKFRGKYKHGPAWLSFVKSAPSQVVSCLLGTGEERDKSALVDLFPKGMDDGHGGRGKGKAPRGGNGETPGRPDGIPDGLDPRIDLAVVDDGFAVGVRESGRVKIEMAFDVVRGDPFARWHEVDFQAENLNVIVVEGSARVLFRSGNQIDIEFPTESPTRVEITGFNDRRDLRVRAKWVDGGSV